MAIPGFKSIWEWKASKFCLFGGKKQRVGKVFHGRLGGGPGGVSHKTNQKNKGKGNGELKQLCKNSLVGAVELKKNRLKKKGDQLKMIGKGIKENSIPRGV